MAARTQRSQSLTQDYSLTCGCLEAAAGAAAGDGRFSLMGGREARAGREGGHAAAFTVEVTISSFSSATA